MTLSDVPLPERDDSEDIQETPPRRRARWEYVVLAIVVCGLLVALYPFLLLVSTVGVFVLTAGALVAFTYWLCFSRRGIIRRWIRFRNLQARRRNRWLLRAAERGRQAGKKPN